MSYPIYAQRDPRWSADKLGTCPAITIGAAGCYLCALAMGATAAGYAVIPPSLNALITQNKLYAQGCEMVDDVLQLLAAKIPGSTAWQFLGVASQAQAQQPQQWHSEAGQFAILGLHLADHDHFVTIVSWDGAHLLIGDPWVGAVVNFDAYYQRSQIFKLTRYQAPALSPPPPAPILTPEQQFVGRVKQALVDLKLA